MKQPVAQSDQHTLVQELLADEDAATLRVLVVRLGAMGDVIHGIPAIAALRRERPNLQIGWLIEERWAELLCAHPLERLQPRSELKPKVDWVHFSNFKDWRKDLSSGATWHDMRTCMREVRAMHYDIALDLQGAAFRALHRATFSAQRIKCASKVVGKKFCRNASFRRNHVAQFGRICTTSIQFFPELGCVRSLSSGEMKLGSTRPSVFCSG